MKGRDPVESNEVVKALSAPRGTFVRFVVVFVATLLIMHSAPPTSAEITNLEVRGLIDLVAHGNDGELVYNTNNLGDSNFDNVRSRLFIEGGTGRTRAFVQVLMSDVSRSRIRVYGAYLTHQLFEGRSIFFEAGKIPSHDGIWGPNTYSHKNPLIGVPFAYYYHSSLTSTQMPTDLAQLVGRRGQGQSGIVYADANGVRGVPRASMPMLYDSCWDYGAYLIGSGQSYDYAFGLTVGSPGAPVAGPDTNGRPTWHVRLGFAPTPGLRLHATAARGPYLSSDVDPYIPHVRAIDDYAQMLWILSVQWDRGHLEFKGEGFLNHYETPLRASGLGSHSYYSTLKYKFLPGWFGALRYDTLRFEEIEFDGQSVSWDDNVQRVEAGLGYHVTHELLVKTVAQISDTGSGWRKVLPAMQFSYRF